MLSSSQPASEIFDPFATQHTNEPFSFFARLQAVSPVYWSEQHSLWILTRYQDVKTALLSSSIFSSSTGSEILNRAKSLPESARADFELCYRFWYTTLQASDAPSHTRKRHLTMKAFTPALIGQMQASIAQRVEDLLDKVLRAGTCDFVSEFAYPLPSLVIFDLLGLPVEFHAALQAAGAAIVRFPAAVMRGDHAQFAGIASHLRTGEDALREVIRRRRELPTEDLISALANETDREAAMPDEDIVVLCNFLLTAGHETTANLLAGSMRYLLSDRRLWEELQQPGLLANAVEELLRFVSPLLWVNRLLTQEYEIDGTVLPKGSRVLLGIGAANHDPLEFESPASLHLTRPKPHSLAFGYGPHFCIGAALARMEMHAALAGLLRRAPQITLAAQTFEYHPVYFLRALKSLPISV